MVRFDGTIRVGFMRSICESTNKSTPRAISPTRPGLSKQGVDPVSFDRGKGGKGTPSGLSASISVALFDLDSVLTSTPGLHQKVITQLAELLPA
jgi:hypothetical protein